MSVANFASSLFMLCILSALYLLLSGMMADLIPLCVVHFIVAAALFGPMPHMSAILIISFFLCLSFDLNVFLLGISCSVCNSDNRTSDGSMLCNILSSRLLSLV